MNALSRQWPVVLSAAWVLFAGLAVVLALHGWRSFGFERAAIEWSAHHRPAPGRRAAVGVTVLGTGAPPYLIALAAGTVLARGDRGARTRRGNAVLLLGPLLWLVGGQLLREALMYAFGRPRPSSAHWAVAATGFSFPSGHSFSSAVCAGLLALAIARRRPSWARTARAAAVLYAVAVGLSRVYVGVHWPLDVVGSWLLAAGWLAAGSAVLDRTGGATASPEETPTRSRGGRAAEGPGERCTAAGDTSYRREAPMLVVRP